MVEQLWLALDMQSGSVHHINDFENGEYEEASVMDSLFPMSQLAQRLPFLLVIFLGDV